MKYFNLNLTLGNFQEFECCDCLDNSSISENIYSKDLKF